ncbi:MAG: hypothetical protein NUV91_08900, partial [Candidatus Omnitrophica bacterium]|nr:hypothetical protein [Candidatus Omnitrophota bacterium]
MTLTTFEVWCHRISRYALYAMIYFLPISIALVESLSAFVIVPLFLKRVFGAWQSRSSSHKIKSFLEAFYAIENPLNKPITIFVAANVISALLSPYLALSWQGIFCKLLQGVFIYVAMLECINNPRRLKIFVTIFFVSIALVSISGIVQFYLGKD